MGDEGRLFCRRGAGGMLPVHMACLSGYSDCVENIIPRGVLVGSVHEAHEGVCNIYHFIELSSPSFPSPPRPPSHL